MVKEIKSLSLNIDPEGYFGFANPPLKFIDIAEGKETSNNNVMFYIDTSLVVT